MTTIEYDSVDLTAAPYYIRQFLHDSMPDRRMEFEPLARARGGVILDTKFGQKSFGVVGKLVCDTQEELEDAIDDMKELLSRNAKNLDVTYGSGTRRYVAYASDLKIERDHYHITHANFGFKFLVPSGIGYDPTLNNHSNDNQTAAAISSSFVVGGSTHALGTIRVAFDSASSCSKVEVTIGGVKISVTSTFSTSDVLLIDCERKKVTKNGTEIDFTGRFPQFEVGTNNYTIDITRTSAQVDIDIEWYDTYL